MKYIFRTSFVHIPASAYAYVRRRLENGFMTLGLAMLWVGFATLFFRIFGFPAEVNGLMVPLALDTLLVSKTAAKFLLENPVILLFSALVFAPVVEEFIFRDLVITLTKGLSDNKRQVIIILVAGVIFGMTHGHPFKIMVQGVFGLLQALLYLRSGPNRLSSYGTCVFVHASYNFIVSVFASG